MLLGSRETNVLHPAGIELSIMRHGCPARAVTGRDGGILPPVSLFLPLSIFLPSLLSHCAIVRSYLSVKPFGREKEGVEAVNLDKTIFCETIF